MIIRKDNVKRYGIYVFFDKDVCANLETGRITSIIVPGGKKLMSMFAKEEYEKEYGPITFETEMDSWKWVTEKWPWEVEV